MRTYQLLTYHLITAEATKNYAGLMAKHIENLRTHGIETHGVFTSPSRYNQVLALVSYIEGTDQALSASGYLSSPDFRTDFTGFDWRQLIRKEDIVLNPLYAAP
jgi:hypothetical protein